MASTGASARKPEGEAAAAQAPKFEPVLPLEEIAKHKTSKDCWVIVRGRVFDVTKFLPSHPGGPDIIVANSGRDATREFDNVGHGQSALDDMERMLIGYVPGYVAPRSTPRPAGGSAVNRNANQSGGATRLLMALAVLVVLVAIVWNLMQAPAPAAPLPAPYDWLNSTWPESGVMVNAAGHNLTHYRYEAAANAARKAVILLVQGYGASADLDTHVAARLAAAGHTVYTMDHQGQGRSSGLPAYISRWTALVDDMLQLTEMVMARHGSGRRYYLVGNSMGGLVALGMAMRQPSWFDGVALLAPAIDVRPDFLPLLRKLTPLLASLAPELPIGTPTDSMPLTHDPAIDAYIRAHPQCYHGRIRAGTGAALLHGFDFVQANAGAIKAPLLLMHGDHDSITDPVSSQRFYHAAVNATDRQLILYPGMYHGITAESHPPGWRSVVDDLLAWIADVSARFPPMGTASSEPCDGKDRATFANTAEAAAEEN